MSFGDAAWFLKNPNGRSSPHSKLFGCGHHPEHLGLEPESKTLGVQNKGVAVGNEYLGPLPVIAREQSLALPRDKACGSDSKGID